MKSLTGELEMFDAFASSFYTLFMAIPNAESAAKDELAQIRQNLTESVTYMREICSDYSHGVSKGKRI